MEPEMTTGHVLDDTLVPNPGGGWLGTYKLIDWVGADRPKSTKSPHNTYTTYRERYDRRARIIVRKEYKFRIPHPASSANRVVKRAYDEEHAYNKSYLRRFHDRVTYTVPSNYAVNSVMDLHGVQNWGAENLLDANDQIKLVGKLKDLLDGSDFNLGVFLGELGPTLDLIGDTAGRLGKAYGFARGGQFGKAADQIFSGTSRHPKKRHFDLPRDEVGKKGFSKALADNWLELQYGWLPLLKDVEAAAQMLAHHLNVPMRKTYRARVRKEKVSTRVSQVGYEPVQKANATAVKTHQRWLIARIEEKGTIPQMLGLSNPELVLWELLPYSFVADWFIPLGQWMEARALVSRLKGTFITSDKRMGVAHCPTSQYFAFQPRGNFVQVIFDRSVSTTLKVPMPTFKPLPKIASWQHCANAVGLLISNFAGRRD